MWSHALMHIDECLTYPCISLAQVDDAYNAPGTAKNIVRGHLIGIYSLSTAREKYNEQAADLASNLFMAKHGKLCTLYDTMLYFGDYLMTYKQSLSAYDVQDILLQFGRRYLPWKRSRVLPEQEQQSKGITIEEMVYRWVAGGRTDEDFHENSGLYRQGNITDKMIQAARIEYQRREADGEVF